jgi:hypothetical protein
MTVIYPLLGLGVTYLACEVWRNLVVEKKGRQLKKAFSNYVSPDLVRKLRKILTNWCWEANSVKSRSFSLIFAALLLFQKV